MSKRGEKSAAIREYIEQNPTAKAREIIDALAKRRIKVSQNQVYGLLSKSNGEAAAPKAPEAKAPESNGHPAVSDMPLIHAKQFITASGGLEKARKVIDFIESLQLT
jgi:hypothetical protein